MDISFHNCFAQCGRQITEIIRVSVDTYDQIGIFFRMFEQTCGVWFTHLVKKMCGWVHIKAPLPT